MYKKFSYITSYGKWSNEQVQEYKIMKDTRENRKQFLEDFKPYDYLNQISQKELESFLNLKIHSLVFDVSDDWDSPTGVALAVTTLEEELHSLESKKKKLLTEFEKAMKEDA